MDLLYDYNHVVDLIVTNATQTLKVIPNTAMDAITLVHDDCRRCYTYQGAEWYPDESLPMSDALVNKTFDFSYNMHLFEVETQGHFWKMNACLNATELMCGSEIEVFAIEQSSPSFFLVSDGFLGLAPGPADNATEDKSVLEQLLRHDMIAKKQFGIHTHMFNSTEDPSRIRFGGYDEDLFAAGHQQKWFNTTGADSWDVPLLAVGLHSEAVHADQKALINPGYPFISMPSGQFEAFKAELKNAYPNEPLTCTSWDWCYFFRSCD